MKDTEWLDRSLVTSPVYFCLCMTPKQFAHELKRLGLKKRQRPDFLPNNHSDAAVHFLECEGKTAAIVVLRRDKTHEPAQVAAMLVHEAVHIWQEIRANLGETAPSAEFEAYSIQAISQRLFYAYIEQTQRK